MSRSRPPSLGASATATFILGGQIVGERPDLFLVYPEGNYIRVSDERPFFQIGETKYGKFMLELAVHAKVDLDDAIKIALSSMLSTARANLSVGPPYDIGIYRPGAMELEELRVEDGSPVLARLQEIWHKHQLAAIAERAALPVMAPGRADVIASGALILATVMGRFGFDDALVSETDILDGLVLEMLAEPDVPEPPGVR